MTDETLSHGVAPFKRMEREHVIASLRAHKEELTASGIQHLRLFGSRARGEARPSSDADLAAEFDRSKRLSLVSRVHLENRLTDIIGVKADLSDFEMLKPEVRERALRESILVF